MNWINRIIAWWMAKRPVDTIRLQAVTPWTKESAQSLKSFLESPIGQAFMRQLEALEIGTNAWACSTWGVSAERAQGLAVGRQLVRNDILRLATSKDADSPKNYDAKTGITDSELQDILKRRINRTSGGRPHILN